MPVMSVLFVPSCFPTLKRTLFPQVINRKRMWFWAKLDKTVLGVYPIFHNFFSYKILPGVGTMRVSFSCLSA